MSSPVNDEKDRLFPVVGIGASAGGLEPLEELFGNLPREIDMAFIIVVHSDPSHETLLPAILSRRSEFEVHVATEGKTLQAGCVYVCPSDSIVTLSGQKLHLTPRGRHRESVLAIDCFFFSLASEFQNRAIAIVLSGNGSDGTLGLREVKAQGGITLAQDEKSAKFYSMPQNAAASGYVDFVLPPKEIALRLQRVAKHGYARSALPVSTAPTPEPVHPRRPADPGFHELLTLIRLSSGIDFTQYKYGTVSRRILRRMALHNIETIPAFCQLLRENPEIGNQVAQDILIQVTQFFREPDSLALLKEKVFPNLVDKRGREEAIRVWVPGCSSGEEVYSILIALTEFLEENDLRFPVQFFGTDLSETAITKARSATYVPNIVNDVSPERLQRFFTKTGIGYEINKSLRDLCVFAKHNVVSDPPFGKLDLITCRNVLIYLESSLQQRALSIFHYALKPQGILLLGNAETVGGVAELYSALDPQHRIYAKKPIASRLYFDFVGAHQTADKISISSPSASLGESASKGIQMQRDADRYLMAEFVPAGVLVDDQLELVQFRGKTSEFFEPSPGFASLQLLNMLKSNLVADVKSAIELSRKQKGPVRKENLSGALDGSAKRLALEVIPMALPSTGDRYFILLFEDMDLPQSKASKRRRDAKRLSQPKNEPSKELESVLAELASTKDYLQAIKEEKESANEELRAANEEVMSSNEELQSTNEELHSAKEELQSTNEELLTVNDELKVRNQDLSHLNDDLTNLFNSSNSAMVLLTRDLKVRRLTPLAESLLRLLPGDVGRSIGDFNIEIKGLQKMLLEVISTAVAVELEIENAQGTWYCVQMKPYRTRDGRVDGAVLLFTDITKMKTSLIYSEAVESIYAHPLVVLGGDLRVKRANKKFYEVFSATPRDTENRFIYDLGNEQWNIPELRELLEKVLSQNSEITNFKVSHRFPKIGQRTMNLSARRLFYQDRATETILLSIETLDVQ